MLQQLKGVFRSLASHDVHYLVIGGIAAILHGVPRATFELDVLIEPTKGNAEKLLSALREAGMTTATLITAEALLINEITVFNDFVRIDVQTHTPGLKFSAAWQRPDTMAHQDQTLKVLCKEDLIASKRAAGRPVDLEDVKMLNENGG